MLDDRLEGPRRVLWIAYGLVPILAGLDKFVGLLADWEGYLAPVVVRLLPVTPHLFLRVVGVIEVVAGVLVLVAPRIGARVVAAWLLSIAASLVLGGHFLDVAVRDVVLALGAWTFARMTEVAGTSRAKVGASVRTA